MIFFIDILFRELVRLNAVTDSLFIKTGIVVATNDSPNAANANRNMYIYIYIYIYYMYIYIYIHTDSSFTMDLVHPYNKEFSFVLATIRFID